ncbi:protein SAWADEE HOMEODOMAIN HOMOLOG 1-like isoform X1 [Coffea arabica]|uniref:Protein SAWADEE HOMEODOMAIN HOMOLOG 1-like isoform X1 n=1 Tax=Coffea arabica TaxID=13443 RepID=A0A6P6XBQ1_COFAR
MDDRLNSVEMENAFDPEFTLAEIVEMENLYKEMGGKSLNQQFYQELATKFSTSVHRCGKSSIGCEQVQSWFGDLEKELEAKVSSFRRKVEKSVGPTKLAMNKSEVQKPSFVKSEEIDASMPAEVPNFADENSQKPKGVSVAELSELVFEARSSKDLAWYDVASFLNYRVTSTGELEVRVRYVGYDKDQDEWLNVKRSVRERSIPLEPSECDRVKVGDLVLCFRENEDDAVYCDARVVDIQRIAHDSDCCCCIFLVRYDQDFFEDQVQLKKLCCRPAT